jgi:pilus assembly protein Flp/PilA
MLEMIRMRISALRDDKRGVTAVEYTVIAALIIVAIASAFTTLGNDISTELGTVASKV